MESVARSVSNNTKQLVEVNAKLQEQLNQGGVGGGATEAKQNLMITELEAINVGVGSIDDKVILGQQTSANSVAVTIASDQTAVNSKLVGEDFSSVERNIKCAQDGRLIVQVDGARRNGSETIAIPDGTTGTSTPILMGNDKFIAFYGDTDNTFNTNIFIEYSQDGVNWFRGAGDNAKIIVVSPSGNFYDEEHVTPPRVRIAIPNTSGANETLQLYYTLL